MFKIYFVILCFSIFLSIVNGKNPEEIKTEPRLAFDENVLKLIKEFQSRMCHPLKKFGLPILEPFEQDKIEIDFKNPLAKIKGSLSNIRVDNLIHFKVNDLELKLGSLGISLKFILPELKVKGSLKAKGSLADLFPIDADGDFYFTIKNIQLDLKAKMHLTETLNKLKEIEATPSIEKFSGRIEKLVPSESVNDFINDALNKHAPTLIQLFWEDFGKEVLQTIEEMSAVLMKDIDKGKVMKLIMSGKGLFDKNDPPADCLKKT